MHLCQLVQICFIVCMYKFNDCSAHTRSFILAFLHTHCYLFISSPLSFSIHVPEFLFLSVASMTLPCHLHAIASTSLLPIPSSFSSLMSPCLILWSTQAFTHKLKSGCFIWKEIQWFYLADDDRWPS